METLTTPATAAETFVARPYSFAATDYNWARLTSSYLTIAQSWLRFMARLWIETIGATDKFSTVAEARGAINNAIKDMAKTKRDHWHTCSLEVCSLAEKFSVLQQALEALHLDNSARLGCQVMDRRNKQLRLAWQDNDAEDQYVWLTYRPDEEHMVTLDWHVGEPRQSRKLSSNLFLGIPILARAQEAEDIWCQTIVKPLTSVRRQVCQKLGMDVSNIRERGVWASSGALHALDKYMKDTEAAVKKWADQAGYAQHESIE